MSYDNERVAEIANWIFEENLGAGDITPQIADTTAFAFQEVLRGSKLMDLVPRPTGGPPGLNWLVTQGVQAAFRRCQAKISFTVLSTVRLKLRSQWAMAKMGI